MSEHRIDHGARIRPPACSPGRDDELGSVPDSIRVWILSGTSHVRWSLVERLKRQAGISVVASAGVDSASFGEALERRRPDVLLLDGLGTNPQDAGPPEEFRSPADGMRVLVLLERADRRAAEDVLRFGFHGILLTTSSTETISKAIRSVCRGDIWMPRALLASVLGSWLNKARAQQHAVGLPAAGLRSLTARERQILAQLKRGLSNKEIAGELGISEDTVKKHLQHVYHKLGVRSRTTVLAGRGLAAGLSAAARD